MCVHHPECKGCGEGEAECWRYIYVVLLLFSSLHLLAILCASQTEVSFLLKRFRNLEKQPFCMR